MPDPQPVDVRWAAMRVLLADLLRDNSTAARPTDREEFLAALRSGADVRDLAALTGLERDEVIATLARLVRG